MPLILTPLVVLVLIGSFGLTEVSAATLSCTTDSTVTAQRDRSLLEYLLANPSIPFLFIAGVVGYLTYRNGRNNAAYRNTIDKFASYRNEEDRMLLKRATILMERSSSELAEYALPQHAQSEDVQALNFVLNEWEEIALGVKYGIYSEPVLYEYYGSIGLSIWKQLRPYMRVRQGLHPRNWREFDGLAVRWFARTSSLKHGVALKELKRLSSQTDSAVKALLAGS